MENLAPQTLYTFPQLTNPDAYDVIIIGGGPAGLSAALILGRCRRKVLVVDSGNPRNKRSHAMHGYLTRDGMPPSELKAIARAELAPYDTVVVTDGKAIDGLQTDDGRFVIILEDGRRYLSRKVLLATGVVDEVPDIPGLDDLYGSSVHHCPICDGYEWRDKRIAVYGQNCRGFGLVQEMTAWSRDLTLLTDGPCDFNADQLAYLEGMRIKVYQEKVTRLEGTDGNLQTIYLEDGQAIPMDAMFFCTGQKQHSPGLANSLGCRETDKGCIWVGEYEMTCIEGVYCCGDASHNAQMVIVAAAEGAVAACAINKALTMEYKTAKLERHAVEKAATEALNR